MRGECRDRCLDVLVAMDLDESLFSHKPSESVGRSATKGGHCKGLVNDPEILLADEPTGNLDSKTGSAIMNLLDELNAGKKDHHHGHP